MEIVVALHNNHKKNLKKKKQNEIERMKNNTEFLVKI